MSRTCASGAAHDVPPGRPRGRAHDEPPTMKHVCMRDVKVEISVMIDPLRELATEQSEVERDLVARSVRRAEAAVAQRERERERGVLQV